jgi:hypothetical protein
LIYLCVLACKVTLYEFLWPITCIEKLKVIAYIDTKDTFEYVVVPSEKVPEFGYGIIIVASVIG